MTISEYVEHLNKRYQSGRSTEHSYRGDLLQLLETLLPERTITNEPRRFDVGAPDQEEFTTYPKAGSNTITHRLTKTDPGFVPDKEAYRASGTKPKRGDRHVADAHREDKQVIGKVWINDQQYFGKVPEKAWNFYIGGYQPAEKWLKDRRGRELSFEEIQHYQKIIVALMETDRIMTEIDKIEIETD